MSPLAIVRGVAMLNGRLADARLHDRGRHLRRIRGIPSSVGSRGVTGESLVTSHSLAAVKVAVDAGIGLVQHVGLVGASSARSRAGAVSSSAPDASSVTGSVASRVGVVGRRLSVSTNCTAAISVRVDARIRSVHQVTAVGSSVARCVSSTDTRAGAVGVVSGVGVVGSGRSSSNSAAAISVRVDARIQGVHDVAAVRATGTLGSTSAVRAANSTSGMCAVSVVGVVGVVGGSRSSTNGAAAVSVRVHTGIEGVHHVAAVGPCVT